MKKNIGIIYGGKSVEHEVSIITGLQAFENLDQSKYNPILIYIDKQGQWFSGKKLNQLQLYKNWSPNQAKQFYPSFNPKDRKNILNQLHVALITTHGTHGEDGRLQGLLDLLNIPYTCCGVVGSASGMDKIVTKQLFKGLNLPTLPFSWFYYEDWLKNKNGWLEQLKPLAYPLIIKPSNLGSSIGISMAKNQAQLEAAIETASYYDQRIIVEQGIENLVEVNCSALRHKHEIMISELEEPVHWEEFLSFEDKYLRGNSKNKAGMAQAVRKIPAQINEELKEKIISWTKTIYQVMDCSGIIRMDFILNPAKTEIYVNEINTIPGSLSFYLWEPAGFQFSQLLDILIDEAFRLYDRRNGQIFSYASAILDKRSHTKEGRKL